VSSKDPFIIPQGWIAREKALRHMRSITEKCGLDPHYVEAAQRAADEDDNARFVEIALAFFEAWAEQAQAKLGDE
jgi:hypothetical protein